MGSTGEPVGESVGFVGEVVGDHESSSPVGPTVGLTEG